MTGLLINGLPVDVPGLSIAAPASAGGPRWSYLSSSDCRLRTTKWVRQIMLHTVRGVWPQSIDERPGIGGELPRYADIWQSDPIHSGAQVIVASDGAIACLCDLATTAAYHAEMSNDWSVGIEMYQEPDGRVHRATIYATARLVQALCALLPIPFQYHRFADGATYRNEPLQRFETHDAGGRKQLGGKDCVGVFGHRLNTSHRGAGDPGDAIFEAIDALGAEALDYSVGEDLHVGRARQLTLGVVADGLVGPGSMAAMRRAGFSRWRDVT